MCCMTFPGVTGTNILFIHVIEHQREIKEKTVPNSNIVNQIVYWNYYRGLRLVT